jgi:hypothetical protein
MLNGEPVVGSSQSHATAVVEEMRPGATSVRLNFVTTVTAEGTSFWTSRDTQILDPEAYHTTFDRIRDAVAVRGGAVEKNGSVEF